jgi:hypothetical protein
LHGLSTPIDVVGEVGGGVVIAVDVGSGVVVVVEAPGVVNGVVVVEVKTVVGTPPVVMSGVSANTS